MAKSIWYGKERLADIKNKLYDRMNLASEFVKDEAKRRSPVDTGNLKSSINKEVVIDNGEIVGRIGTNVEYAGYLEYGTRKMSAQPYLRPALLENKKKIKKFLNDN